jgi:hypothetical protein
MVFVCYNTRFALPLRMARDRNISYLKQQYLGLGWKDTKKI